MIERWPAPARGEGRGEPKSNYQDTLQIIEEVAGTGTLIYMRPRDFKRFERILRINQYFNLSRGPRDFSSAENLWEETVTFEIQLAGRQQGGALDRSLFGSSYRGKTSPLWNVLLACLECSWHQSAGEWRASWGMCSGAVAKGLGAEKMPSPVLPGQSPQA